ncbi:hypothetical protein JZ751_018391 [Albula glossodonta]|uniref:Uncharacterized protein n=1 Tax=Albula glossodonta TaxID=121402 RepID=A0A8T2MI55_9TELE|nr:hypothetical protein JZ751_018391 [Albula glossodonta]
MPVLTADLFGEVPNNTYTVRRRSLLTCAMMEKSGRLWGLLGRWLLALGSWSWGVCRVSLLALILTFHLYGGFLLLGLILVSVAGILYKFQDVLLYFPDQPSSSRLYVPMPTGIPHENVFIRAKDACSSTLSSCGTLVRAHPRLRPHHHLLPR